MTDDQTPLFAHDEPGPRFTIKDLSRALTRLGLEYPTANSRVAAYAKARHIHVREKGAGATSPNKFALADMAAAVLLSAVQDTGIADHDVLARVSLGLYCWTAGVKVQGSHPLLAALRETIRGEAIWQLQIDFYRHGQTGERSIVVSFFRAGEISPNVARDSDAITRLRTEYPDMALAPDPRNDPEYLPIASILVPATVQLLNLQPFVVPSGN